MDLAIPRRGVLGDALKERGLIFHHDSTPQGNITSDGLGNISNNKRRRSLLNIGIRLREESDNIEVSKNILGEHRQNGKSCGGLHGGDYVDSTFSLNGRGLNLEWDRMDLRTFYEMKRIMNDVTRQV